MNLNPEIEQRIHEAAEQLYAATGRARLPTVDAVRKLAKTNMNDASIAMKAWRADQARGPIEPASATPDAVQRLFASALADLWSTAQSHANAALAAAQAGWQAERTEAEAERESLTAAFDEQSKELAAMSAANGALEVAKTALTASEANATALLAARDEECRTLRSSETSLRALIIEQGTHIEDLRRETEQSAELNKRIQKDLDDIRGANAALTAAEADAKTLLAARDEECRTLRSSETSLRALIIEHGTHIEDLRREAAQSAELNKRIQKELDDVRGATGTTITKEARRRSPPS